MTGALVALRGAARDLAADRGDLALEVAHARLGVYSVTMSRTLPRDQRMRSAGEAVLASCWRGIRKERAISTFSSGV